MWIVSCCGVRKLTRAPRFSAPIVECKEDFLIENVFFLDPSEFIVLLETNVNGG